MTEEEVQENFNKICEAYLESCRKVAENSEKYWEIQKMEKERDRQMNIILGMLVGALVVVILMGVVYFLFLRI